MDHSPALPWRAKGQKSGNYQLFLMPALMLLLMVPWAVSPTEPDTVTPLAFAALDPPEDPKLLFRRDPPVPDFQLRPEDVDAATVTDTPILWITGSALSQEPSRTTVEAMLRTRHRRRHTVLDLDYRPTFWRSREEASARIGAAIAHATVAVCNQEECQVAVETSEPGAAAAALRGLGITLAVVKQGPRGVLACDDAGLVHVPPVPVQVVNGLGAGDAFGGALCHGLLRGWETRRTMRFANAAGAIVAGQLACSDAMPAEHEVQCKLEEAGDD